MSSCRNILLIVLLPALARAETLPAVVARALANNPELRAARARVEATAGRASQSRLWPNPELELSAEEVPVDSGGLSQSKNLIGLTQTVPFPGKKSLDSRIGGKEFTAAEWELVRAEADLVKRVKTAFYRALASQRKLEVAEELVELARSTATTAQKRVESGAASDQEQLRADIELERALTQRADARAESVAARKSLDRLAGVEVRQLEGDLPATVELPAAEPGNHPLIRAALAHRERAELEHRRAKLEAMPDVTLGVAGGRDAAENETLMEFRVSVPLPVFDRAQGRKREARALAEMARYDVTATEQQLAEELGVLEARLRAASEQVAAYRDRILPKAEESLRLVRGGFEAGKFGFLDLVDTQRTLAEARLAYYDKLLELNTTAAELEYWSVGGTE